ncbi:uncharacterized protein BXZ73DRAFT_90020 [Epithele typhae]|uniref:uncharacterized protein n=1 Tax=Epithele typhae TaxID=378194 RepID=UPI0020078B18|nr:uncharacterized protein BXZ73DRAFT_90020 [Epithele typhae]KAH9932084.1 hypothetical protein BXZ73DRAFT_90020 [Epithele typhae]
MDDDDSYLYGESTTEELVKPAVETSGETRSISEGLVAKLEEQAADDTQEESAEGEPTENGEEDEEEEDEDSEDDVEIIMDEPIKSHSLDLRATRPAQPRAVSSTQFTSQRPPPPSLTTEYTPRDRAAINKITSTPQPSSQTPQPGAIATPSAPAAEKTTEGEKDAAKDTGPDPNTLPAPKAAPSHPSIKLNEVGVVDGQSILEYDLNAMSEKPWRRPGSDLSDWFNYGFDEMTWQMYCNQRQSMVEHAGVLKNSILNFSGLPEEQLLALPQDVRQAVLAGATTVMAGGGGMMTMNGGPMMNQMMNMGPMMNPMMDGAGQGNPEGQMGMVGEGFGPGGGAQGMMGMNMNPDFAMQVGPNAMGQQMYPGMEGNGTPGPVAPAAARNVPQQPFRGRGMPQGMGPRGRGAGFAGRGRGMPVRPASPLPPNVPTGPRNKNKYKDIDGSAPAVDGLDYGGGGGGSAPVDRERSERSERNGDRKERGTPDLDERDRSSRKRRASPGDREESRSSKRR